MVVTKKTLCHPALYECLSYDDELQGESKLSRQLEEDSGGLRRAV